MAVEDLDPIYQQILAKLPPDEAGRLIRQINPEPGPRQDPLSGVSPGSAAGTIEPMTNDIRVRNLAGLGGLFSMEEQPYERAGFESAKELLDPSSYGTAGKIFQTLAPMESNVLGAVRGIMPDSRQDLPGTVGTVASMAMGAAAPGAQAAFASRPTPPSFAPGQAAQMARGRVRANPLVQGALTTNPAGKIVRKGPYSTPVGGPGTPPATGVRRAGGIDARMGGAQTPTEARMGPPGSPRRMARASETLKRKPGQAGPSTRLEEMKRTAPGSPGSNKPVPAPGPSDIAGPEGKFMLDNMKKNAQGELAARMKREQLAEGVSKMKKEQLGEGVKKMKSEQLGEGVRKMKKEQLGEGVEKMKAEQAAENPESSIDVAIERFRQAGLTAEQIWKLLRNKVGM